jgi:hypothetical protein
MLAMVATLLTGGLAVSSGAGMLLGDDVMAYRENRVMERKFEQLANYVVAVTGFHPLGQLVADRLRETGRRCSSWWTIRFRPTGRRIACSVHWAYSTTCSSVARLESAKSMVVTTHDSNNNLASTLLAHTLNASLAIAVPSENPLRKGLFESAGASSVVIADEIIANALISRLTAAVETAA